MKFGIGAVFITREYHSSLPRPTPYKDQKEIAIPLVEIAHGRSISLPGDLAVERDRLLAEGQQPVGGVCDRDHARRVQVHDVSHLGSAWKKLSRSYARKKHHLGNLLHRGGGGDRGI